MQLNCQDCAYYEYDEEDDAWYCTANIDEDDFGRLFESKFRNCPYYRRDDEYQIVRKQI